MYYQVWSLPEWAPTWEELPIPLACEVLWFSTRKHQNFLIAPLARRNAIESFRCSWVSSLWKKSASAHVFQVLYGQHSISQYTALGPALWICLGGGIRRVRTMVGVKAKTILCLFGYAIIAWDVWVFFPIPCWCHFCTGWLATGR